MQTAGISVMISTESEEEDEEEMARVGTLILGFTFANSDVMFVPCESIENGIGVYETPTSWRRMWAAMEQAPGA